MKVFVDTNVIADWLIPTNTFHAEATDFMKLCLQRKVYACVSSHSLTDLFYITRKYFNSNERYTFIRLLISRLGVLTEDAAVFSTALKNSALADLEDALQIACAEREGVDFIVTENLKDFTSSKIPTVSIKSALEKVANML